MRLLKKKRKVRRQFSVGSIELESDIEKQEEERFKKSQTRNIVLYSALVLFCVGAYGVSLLFEPDEPDYSQMSFCFVYSIS